jgi:hypothetical protein
VSDDSSRGGSSKHFVAKSLMLARAVHGLGLPGSSSQRNGTAAELWNGGVSMPEGSVDCISGTEKSGSLGVKLPAGSAALPISRSLSFSQIMSLGALLSDEDFTTIRKREESPLKQKAGPFSHQSSLITVFVEEEMLPKTASLL